MEDFERAYEFVARAAHDLRNPISVMVGAADLLDRSWNQLSDELRREQVAAIAGQARRLRELTQDLLDWASLESGRINLHLEEVALLPVVSAASKDAADGWPVEIKFGDEMVRADRSHLKRVMVNLLSNARRYGRPPIRVEAELASGEVVVKVIDFGPGVPGEILDRLFEPFVKGSSEGSGLGLAIVRGLMEIQSGRVWYEPRYPGACFAIALPTSAAT